jgi:GNAT superfamily N-acetyltransferase
MTAPLVQRLRAALPERVKRPVRGPYRRVRQLIRPDPPPPLLMRYASEGPPAVAPLRAPFTWKVFEPADIPGWLDLLNANGELGRWTEQSLTYEMKELMPGTQHFVVHEGRFVAGVGVYDRPMEHGVAWELRGAARRPEYRGAGLGEQIIASAVASALQLPARPIVLFTDDYRLPGISLYLRLGFIPDLEAHASYQARWASVLRVIDRISRRAARPAESPMESHLPGEAGAAT